MSNATFHRPISDEVILAECRIYKHWEPLYLKRDGSHKEIELPKFVDTTDLRGLGGFFLHGVLAVVRSTASLFRFYGIQERTSWKRIETDCFSFEPEACGMHSAFTHIGLARLGRKDLEGAIQSLSASCRVRPCPHTSSFGLYRSLRNALYSYTEAREAVAEYDSFAREFGGKRYWDSTPPKTV